MATGFGQTFTPRMMLAEYDGEGWSDPAAVPVEAQPMHPAAHVLHYASTCFEGLKAYRRADGGVHLFRLDRHVARMQASARRLCLPIPPTELLESAIRRIVDISRDAIPEYPGALYLRPLLIGTQPNIGAAATPSSDATLFVLASPVGDYFAGGLKPLRIMVEEELARAAPGFGEVKTGGNYAAALATLQRAKQDHQVTQVLFCPGGDVQETGAANFLLIDGQEILTKPLDGTVLAGVTRDSLLQLAGDLGMTVSERDFTVDEMMERLPRSEAALSGTAAVLAPVGVLVRDGVEHTVGNGEMGPVTRELRERLTAIQSGEAADPRGWRVAV